MKKAYILNLITFLLILFSTLWMFSGIKLVDASMSLSASRINSLRYYTVDSNIFMGLVALCMAILEGRVIKGKLDRIPLWAKIVKLVGVVGVTLTMLVTVFFLAPTMGPAACFLNSNFFLHLVNPIISIVTYLCYEASDEVAFGHTFTGIITMVIYAIYYLAEAIIHSTNGFVNPGYDWYGFLVLGLKSGFVVIPIIFLVTYLISFGLWKINRVIYKKKNN